MANQDRIKKAKEELKEWVEMHSGMIPSEDLNAFEKEVKERQWFIEQAEEAEELREENKRLKEEIENIQAENEFQLNTRDE